MAGTKKPREWQAPWAWRGVVRVEDPTSWRKRGLPLMEADPGRGRVREWDRQVEPTDPAQSGSPADADAGHLPSEAMHKAQGFVHTGVRHLHDAIRAANEVVACQAGDVDGHLAIIAGAGVARTCGNLHGKSGRRENSIKQGGRRFS